MKKLLMIATAMLAVVLSSCSGPKFISDVYYLDYYKIGNEGRVLLSESNSYSGEYVSLGSIVIEQRSGEQKVKIARGTATIEEDDGIYGAGKIYDTAIRYKSATYETALEEGVKVTTEMGGDAIINLKFATIHDNKYNPLIQVSGMVIKRK